MIEMLRFSGSASAKGGCLSGLIPYSGTDLSSCGSVLAGAIRILPTAKSTMPFAVWLSVFSSWVILVSTPYKIALLET